MKTTLYTLGLLALAFIFAPDVLAQGFVQVQPLTSLGIATSTPESLAPFINQLYKYGIGIGAIMAVLIIMYGGFKYMTSEAMGPKSAGKEDIQRAVLGLLLLMSPVLVFGVINQDILDLNLDLGRLKQTTPGTTGTTTPSTLTYMRFSYIQASERGGEACLEEENQSLITYPSLELCAAGEGWYRGGRPGTYRAVLTKSCSGETYSPPIPTTAWDAIKDLPACSSITSNPIARQWVGKLAIRFIESSTGAESTVFYPEVGEDDLEVVPDATKTVEEQEAECLAKTTPEGFMQIFNTSEIRTAIGASEILGITEFLHTRACTDYTN